MAQSKFLTINNLKLHYLDFGGPGGAAPDLVCIHGLSQHAHNFDAIAPVLAETNRVLAIDVRGRGDSQWGPPSEYFLPYYVDDLAKMLDQLRIDRVRLVGTSMGGLISILFAGSQPSRVERLVLNDVGPAVDPKGLDRIAGYFYVAPTEFKSMAEVISYYREIYPPLATAADREIARWVEFSVKRALNGALVWKMDPAVRTAMQNAPASAPAPDLWPIFAQITSPVLVIRGAQSDILAPETVARMRHVLLATKAVEVPGVGHAPSLSEPEAVQALREFMA